ncbi:MAG: GNAT family N-acetyltransferase, partial [Lachnospiraceae bacterium]|nr:GNAT family N-acetyltransferase [Lachnospiraceae bacterium]
MSITKQQIRFLENIAANGHVGLEQIEYDGWELRFTHGFTGRANSVQLKGPSTIDLSEKIAFCEKEYASHGLPCIFKLTDADRDFISFLEQRGYAAVKPTDVMLLPLQDYTADYDP